MYDFKIDTMKFIRSTWYNHLMKNVDFKNVDLINVVHKSYSVYYVNLNRKMYLIIFRFVTR